MLDRKWRNVFSDIFIFPVTLCFLHKFVFAAFGNKQNVLKVNWSDFHLSSLGGVVVSFPVIPVDSISERWVFSVMIQTLQVGSMTACIPPGSFVGHSTVTRVAVIVPVFSCKRVTAMTRKGITSRSWKKKKKLTITTSDVSTVQRSFSGCLYIRC